MDTTGLRRNNLLDVDGNHWHVDSILPNELYFKENDEYNHILNAKPIPLTEEWLTRFGFEYRKCGMDVNHGPFCHYDYWVLGKFFIRGNGTRFGYESDIAVKLEYVHQLQNLYHALTGEELTISEEATI